MCFRPPRWRRSRPAALQFHFGWDTVNYGVAPLIAFGVLGLIWLRRVNRVPVTA
ncbi:MAG: hypothetical protein WDO24_00330 [Pseudomonadota bacterium]